MLSILVCTWNNSRQLDVTLSELLKCDLSIGLAWELVIVNNNSSDDTESVINNYKDGLPIVSVFEPKQGLSHARNAGLKVAQGELIIFTDDDVFPCPDWLSIYWKAYVKNSKQCFFGGPVESVYEGEKPDQGLLKWAPASVQGLDYGNEERFINSDEAFLAANWACSREALNKVGGFDPNLGLNPALNEVRTGEEKDIMNRLLEIGCQGLYLPQAKIGHFVPNDKCQFKHIMARREAYGREVALEHMKTYDGKFFMDTPLWIYKKLAQDYIQLLSNKISHKETYDVHASLYYIKGMTKEIQNIRKRR